MLLAALDAALVLVPAREAPGDAAGAVELRGRRRNGPFEERAHLGRIACEHLGDRAAVVEAYEHVGDDEAALGEPAASVGEPDGRFELRDVVVAEVADDWLGQRFGLLEADEAVAAADERVAPEPALLDGLEQERPAARAAQVEVGPERGEEIGVEDGCAVHG